MKTYNLKARILIPLALSIVALVGVFVFSLYWRQQKLIKNSVESTFRSVEVLFMGQLNSQYSMMGAVLDVLIEDEELKVAMKAKDRKALLDRVATIFGSWSEGHKITLLCFTSPDLVNVLRVHKPDKYGDKVNHWAILQAKNTGVTTRGFELCALGIFTFQVVEPWYDGGQLIGYVELGEEIEHTTRKLHDILGVDIYVVIEKKNLDQEAWEAEMRMLGRKARWDQFPSAVVVYQTQDVMPEYLASFFHEEHDLSEVTEVGGLYNDRRSQTRFFSLYDASGVRVGDMVVMTDITEMARNLRHSVFIIGAICFAVAGTLFILFYIFIGKTEKIISR